MTENVLPTEEITTAPLVEKKDYKNTVFKSAYYHGAHMLNLFLNFDLPQAPGSFSILIKKGKFVTVYNLTPAEKLSFAKAVIGKLTPEEVNVIFQGMK